MNVNLRFLDKGGKGEVIRIMKKAKKQSVKIVLCLLIFGGRSRRYRKRKYPRKVIKCGVGIL